MRVTEFQEEEKKKFMTSLLGWNEPMEKKKKDMGISVNKVCE